MNRRKQGSGALQLSNWILLNKFSVVADPQRAGSPTIAGSVNNQLQTQSDLQTKDQMNFTITCRVADKRPNGLLVLEGVKSVNNNEDAWEQCLTGVVRPEDIMPNNTVTSDKVAELRVFKREAGYVRDGYRRGWLLKWLDTYQPF
jgi:flagellar L-ring protein precursor FlgH